MEAGDRLIAELRQWVGKADNDLTNASHTLRLGKRCPTDTVAFHAQQCVEKYLKALLTAHAVPFPRTHDLATLVGLLRKSVHLPIDAESQDTLTDYATTTRYPGDDQEISLAEAQAAVRIARRLRKKVRSLLPRAAILRKKT